MSEPLIPLRKTLAGSDSFGNEWATDDAVVAVPASQAVLLLAIPDGGFTEAPGEPAHHPEHPGADEDAAPAARPPRKPPPHAKKPAAKGAKE